MAYNDVPDTLTIPPFRISCKTSCSMRRSILPGVPNSGSANFRSFVNPRFVFLVISEAGVMLVIEVITDGDILIGVISLSSREFRVVSILKKLVAACDWFSPLIEVVNGIRVARRAVAILSVTNGRVDPGSIIALTCCFAFYIKHYLTR